RDLRSRLPEAGARSAQLLISHERRKSVHRAKRQLPIQTQSCELWKAAQSDDDLRNLLAPFHVRQQIRSPGQEHRVGRCRRQMIGDLGDRPRSDVPEARKANHVRDAFSAALASTPASTGRPVGACGGFDARPSPPSHGGVTLIASGQGTAGNSPGPTRAGLPDALSESALRIFSGVIGTSSMRTPTASKTALATAGMIGSSGPWPTSFAPNGPAGSGCSTSSVKISGMSRLVGLLYSRIDGNLCTSACE